jgi:hypothetical protein
MIPRIDYGALLLACRAVGYDSLPEQPPKVRNWKEKTEHGLIWFVV